MKILIVEDDTLLLQGLILAAQTEGYACDGVSTARMAEQSLEAGHYSLVVLDLGLPDEDGLHFLARIRQKKYTLPVLILTARDTLTDKIAGLDVGADDYLVKPYAAGELLARIRALTRRPGNFKQSPSAACSNISLDPEKRELTGPLGTLQLSKRESALMEYLIRNKGQVLPRGLILSYIWGPDSDVEEGNLDNYIYFLRRRLKSIGALPQIKTVHGIGYRLEIGGTHD